jgi:hypothetical protein
MNCTTTWLVDLQRKSSCSSYRVLINLSTKHFRRLLFPALTQPLPSLEPRCEWCAETGAFYIIKSNLRSSSWRSWWFPSPLILKFREKIFKKSLKKSILKQVVVCWCAVYISDKFEKNSSRTLLMCCIVYISEKFGKKLKKSRLHALCTLLQLSKSW